MKTLAIAFALVLGACSSSSGSVNTNSATGTTAASGASGSSASGAGTSGSGISASGVSVSGAGAGTNGNSSSGSTGSMIIGGPCPANIPNLGTGVTDNPQPCTMTELGGQCPLGFSCVQDLCLLNGGDGPLQVTLSWDDPEDLDLHVVEPQAGGPEDGGCEIWWGNIGPRPDSGYDVPDSGLTFFNCIPVGWLDRDSDSACKLDGINIENVIYPSDQPAPIGEYIVRVDYWANCDANTGMSHPSTNYAVQVRANGSTTTYCGSLSSSQADMGGYEAGTVVATFSVP